MSCASSNDGCTQKKPSKKEWEIINQVLPIKELIRLNESVCARKSGGGGSEPTYGQTFSARAAALMTMLSVAGVSVYGIHYTLNYTGYLDFAKSAFGLANAALEGCGSLEGTFYKFILPGPSCAQLHQQFEESYRNFWGAVSSAGLLGAYPTYSKLYDTFLYLFTSCNNDKKRNKKRTRFSETFTPETPETPTPSRRRRRLSGSREESGRQRPRSASARVHFGGAPPRFRKKYRERPSPPYPANDHCGMKKLGNDGHYWYSVPNKNGVCSWRPRRP